MKEMVRPANEIMTIPTAQLKFPPLTADKVWPATMALTMVQPVVVARFRRATMPTAYRPKLYRVWTICRRPVCGPNIPSAAGGIAPRSEKNKIVRDAASRLRPSKYVPTRPVMMLKML